MSGTAKRAVVGVIGHVDHGKTALVRALTGMETDRLDEEKRRGISIALGFAHLQAGGATIDLIDMPGHERFVRTMVSGATGIDAALLVVAANEGIKPQTVEHMDIAALLGLQRVVIAISKADLVCPAEAAAVGGMVAALAGAAGMQVGATVATSVQTGEGVPALQDALGAVVQNGAAVTDDGFPYLPIDRVFSMAGHGTVVTGTLRRGTLAVSDEIELAPDSRIVRIRGLQVHGERTARLMPGQRVAVNLRDVAADSVARGAAITARGVLPPSPWLTVRLHSVPGAPILVTSTKHMLLFGTDEVEARLRLLDCDELEPDHTALAQLKCAVPVSLPARERFILRRISPPLTIAGGRIIDPAAFRLRRHAPRTLARLAAIATAEPPAIIATEIEAAGPAGTPLAQLARLAGVAEARAAALLQALPAQLGRSKVAVALLDWKRVLDAIPGVLAGKESELPPDRLRALLPWAGPAVIADAADELVRRGTLIRSGGGVRLPAPAQDRARADDETAAAAAMAALLRKAGFSPPDIWVVAPDPKARRVADRLIREGVAVRADDKVQKRQLLFHRDAVEAAQQRLRPLLAAGPGLLVSEAGTALGISRKYCVPLLEHLDQIGFTQRIGDRRLLRVRATHD